MEATVAQFLGHLRWTNFTRSKQIQSSPVGWVNRGVGNTVILHCNGHMSNDNIFVWMHDKHAGLAICRPGSAGHIFFFFLFCFCYVNCFNDLCKH